MICSSVAYHVGTLAKRLHRETRRGSSWEHIYWTSFTRLNKPTLYGHLPPPFALATVLCFPFLWAWTWWMQLLNNCTASAVVLFFYGLKITAITETLANPFIHTGFGVAAARRILKRETAGKTDLPAKKEGKTCKIVQLSSGWATSCWKLHSKINNEE